jgi:hypothetical protein
MKPEALRDWHRLFGLLLTDFFTGSPFTVELERDLSVQQQRLDVVIVRKSPGRFVGRLPDGLDGLREHNLLTFKSHREALDAWAMKELIGHSVAYRKLVSPKPSALIPEDQFGLYAVCARFPQQVSGQVPWKPVQPGVYDCEWGTDTIRVLVAGELPREAHNADGLESNADGLESPQPDLQSAFKKPGGARTGPRPWGTLRGERARRQVSPEIGGCRGARRGGRGGMEGGGLTIGRRRGEPGSEEKQTGFQERRRPRANLGVPRVSRTTRGTDWVAPSG